MSNQKQADAAAADAASLRDQLARLNEQFTAQQAQMRSASAHESESQHANQATLVSLQRQLTDANAESRSLQQRTAQLSSELEEQRREAQQVAAHSDVSLHITVDDSSVSAEALQRQLADLTQQLSEERHLRQELAAQVSASAQSARQADSAQIDSLHAQLAELTQQLADKEQQSIDSEQLSRQQEATSGEISSLRSQLTQISQQLSAEHEQGEHLRARLQEAEEAVSFGQQQQASSTELELLRMQLADLSQQLSTQHEERAQSAAQHSSDVQQLVDNKQREAEAAMAEAASLHEQLREARQQLTGLQGQHQTSPQVSAPSPLLLQSPNASSCARQYSKQHVQSFACRHCYVAFLCCNVVTFQQHDIATHCNIVMVRVLLPIFGRSLVDLWT